MENEPVWKQVDSASYLFLKRLFELKDNSLTVILEEAIANRTKSAPISLPGGIDFGDGCPIEPTSDCCVFTLHWKSYVSYCVTEEMVGSCGKYEDEEYTGKLLRLYSKSHFLEFVDKDTGAHFEPYRHYKITCQSHVIDVVATGAPELASLSREEAGLTEETGMQWRH